MGPRFSTFDQSGDEIKVTRTAIETHSAKTITGYLKYVFGVGEEAPPRQVLPLNRGTSITECYEGDHGMGVCIVTTRGHENQRYRVYNSKGFMTAVQRAVKFAPEPA